MTNMLIINEKKIYDTLAANETNTAETNTSLRARIHDILDKAHELHGLTLEETSALLAIDDPELQEEIFDTARQVKEESLRW
ncbi:MAG: thiamine biosynthesis protein ThiH [uncultured bacterium]|nr:MAG: thiamine biosynthesis protein ThiH [uncultured bacterium]